MGMSDDQKAMLRLLAQREQGYEDMAALMGLSVEEVRAKVKEALAELDEAEKPVEEAPTAAPQAPAEDLPPPPASNLPVEEAPAPPAEAPAVPSAPSTPPKPDRPKAKPAGPSSAPRPTLSLPKDRGALIGLGAGAAVVVVFVILLVSGVLGDGGDSEPGAGSSDAPNLTGEPTNIETGNSNQLTQAALEPTDGSDAKGRALFGRFKNNVLLQVEAEGLEPTPDGESYTVWLYRTPKFVLRVGAVKVNDSEGITAQFPIPKQLLSYVANGAFDQIDISLTDDADYKAEVKEAKTQKRLPAYMGTSVLRGDITGPAIKR